MKRKVLLGVTVFALSFGCVGTVMAEDSAEAVVSENTDIDISTASGDLPAESENEVSDIEVDESTSMTDDVTIDMETASDSTEQLVTESREASLPSGWIDKEDGKHYFDPEDGTEAVNMTKEIEGKVYLFDNAGVLVCSKWQKIDENWYYGDKDGVVQTGWLLWNKDWYYLDPDNDGIMAANDWYQINNRWYHMNSSGVMATDWRSIDGTWYFFSTDGTRREGWQMVRGRWYYLQPGDGKMLANGWHQINNRWYYLSVNGDMATGWKTLYGNTYYLSSDGAMREGWQQVNNKWYYFKPGDGNMVTNGWNKINNRWYYLNSNGEMATGWKYLYGNYYYLDKNGAMCEGWQQINGNWYYFYHENDKNGGAFGVMAKNTTIDGYRVDAQGIYSEVYNYAKRILDSVGWNLPAAFNWCAHSLSYSYTPASASADSSWYAMYGYQYGTGDCYVFASTFCHLARALGYEAYFVKGYVPQLGGGSVTHGWVEIVVNGTVYVCDPDFTYETGRNGYMINYGNSGTWRYSNYARAN